MTLYRKGKLFLRTISQGISNPQALATDASGHLFVANYIRNTGSVSVYE